MNILEILLIDDDTGIHNHIRLLMRQNRSFMDYGLVMREAFSSDDAIGILQNETWENTKIAVIFLDIVMGKPEEYGYKVIEFLKRGNLKLPCKLIVITGQLGVAIESEANFWKQYPEVDGFISKDNLEMLPSVLFQNINKFLLTKKQETHVETKNIPKTINQLSPQNYLNNHFNHSKIEFSEDAVKKLATLPNIDWHPKLKGIIKSILQKEPEINIISYELLLKEARELKTLNYFAWNPESEKGQIKKIFNALSSAGYIDQTPFDVFKEHFIGNYHLQHINWLSDRASKPLKMICYFFHILFENDLLWVNNFMMVDKKWLKKFNDPMNEFKMKNIIEWIAMHFTINGQYIIDTTQNNDNQFKTYNNLMATFSNNLKMPVSEEAYESNMKNKNIQIMLKDYSDNYYMFMLKLFDLD